MQTLDPVIADVTVAVSVCPGLQAEFDAVKVARLMRHINTIVCTIQEAIDPSDVTALGDFPLSLPPPQMLLPYLPDTVSDASAIKDRSIVTAAANREMPSPNGAIGSFGQTISPTHCYVDVTVDLPLISINLFVTDNHSVTLLVSDMDTHVLVRQHDVQVYFALKSLKLLDSLRGLEQEAIIFTPPLTLAQRQQQKRRSQTHKYQTQRGSNFISSDFNPTGVVDGNEKHSFDRVNQNLNSLISVRYAFMYNRQSPLFVSHGQDLNVEFTSLGLSIDEEAVLRLKPFLEMLAKEIAVGVVPVQVTPTPLSTLPLTPLPTKVAAVGPIGMLVTVSIGSVSLSLMRSAKPKSSRGDSRLFSLIASESTSILEGAFSMEITDMTASIDMRIATSADVALRSFTVLDCRPVSQNYVYREMLCRSTLGSQHNSDAYSSIDRNNRAGQLQGTKGGQEEDSDILTVMYREDSKHASTVEVELRNITSFISVDSIIELIDVASSNMAAVMTVVAALSAGNDQHTNDMDFNSVVTAIEEDGGRIAIYKTDTVTSRASQSQSDDSPFSWLNSTNNVTDTAISDLPGSAEKIRLSRTHRSTRANSVRLPKGRPGPIVTTSTPDHKTKGKETPIPTAFLLNVIVSVVSPRLLLLEDPESADSRAIVVRSGVSVHYCNDSKTGALTAETIHVSLQTLEIFALTGLTQGRPQQIGEHYALHFIVVSSPLIALDSDILHPSHKTHSNKHYYHHAS